MELNINSINKAVGITNFVVSKLFPLAAPITSQAAVVTQTGATAVASVNGSSELSVFNTGLSVSGPVIALTAKVEGFLLAMGTAALYGTGATLATGAVFSAGGLALTLTLTAGVVAAATNATVRDILTDPDFWDAWSNDGFDGIDNYLESRTGFTLSDLIDKVFEGFVTGQIPEFSRGQSASVNTSYLGSRSFAPRRDPLALDLDADGLETTAIGGAATVLFDHDGDSIKTGTGWLKGDDAFLALDRNNNGTIDTGAELFGVDTVLATGPNAGQKAANGFAALADLDSNLDGKFSNLDTQFANVRLWRDLNQDGISQSDELTTLTDAGITSINLTSSTTNIALTGGNVQTAAGTYTKSNGQTGTVGEFTTGSTGNLDLAQNPFYSEFTDHTPLTPAAQGLANMQGSGMVRDLREAASLDAKLVADVNALSGTSRTQMMSQLDGLIADWADTSGMEAANDFEWRMVS